MHPETKMYFLDQISHDTVYQTTNNMKLKALVDGNEIEAFLSLKELTMYSNWLGNAIYIMVWHYEGRIHMGITNNGGG
jgi:hypothetical protein